MDIAPISGIRVLPAPKAQLDSLLAPVYDVNATAWSGEDSYNGQSRASSGGQDEDNDEDEVDETEDGQPYVRRSRLSRGLSIFA